MVPHKNETLVLQVPQLAHHLYLESITACDGGVLYTTLDYIYCWSKKPAVVEGHISHISHISPIRPGMM
jgi:hypothetical protein